MLLLGLCITTILALGIFYLLHIPWLSGLHRKCVVVTGCDSGFGSALARSLYNKGVYVFAGCYTEKGAQQLAKATGERLRTFHLDVASTESIEKAFEFVKSNLPAGTELWGLVNNAGVPGDTGPLEFMTRRALRDAMEVNCFGMIEMARVFLPLLKQSRGRIVNIASTCAVVVFPLIHPYLTSKFALKSFSEALRMEARMWGITVCTLCPGWFRTDLVNADGWTATFKKQWRGLDPAVREDYGQEYFDKQLEIFANSVPTDAARLDLSPVVEAYEHALFARWPYSTYYPGNDAKYMVFLKTCGPSFIINYITEARLRGNTPGALRK